MMPMMKGVRFVLALAVLLGAGNAGAETAIVKRCFHEPLFQQQLCVYEANPAAAETVLFIHGLNGNALRDWKLQLQALAPRYHVLAMELPGFHTMAKDPSLYSARTYARVVNTVVTRYVHGPLHLVGHSMGGVIALRYLIDYPGRVERLVLTDVAGLLHRIAYSRALLNGWLDKEGEEDDVLSVAADKIAIKLLIGLDSYAQDIAAQHVGGGEGEEWFKENPAASAAFGLLNEDFSGSLESITQSVLLLWGSEDHIAPIRTAYLLQDRLLDSRLRVIAGAGHMPMRSQSELFNRELLAFLGGEETKAPEVPPVVTPLQEGHCLGESGKVFEGRYTRIVLKGCQHAVLRHVTAQSIEAASSRFDILNSDIGGGVVALSVTGSDVHITASRLVGETAIHASGSRLDMAGVELVGRRQAVTGDRRSQLIFSLSDIDSPGWQGPIHAYLEVDRDHPL